MRPFVLGLLGGLAAIVLVAGALGGFLVSRARPAPDPRRATLTADLDAYAAWWRDDYCRHHPCQTIELPEYVPARDRFLVDRPTLRDYLAWWREDRWDRYGGGYSNAIVMVVADPALLADPATIDWYLAQQR